MKISRRVQQPADTPAPPSEDAVTELMNAWWTATQAMKRHVAPMLEREHGLEFKDFIALSAIESGATYPGVVCSRLTMTPSTVSRLLDDLVRGGLLVRRLDDTDSRRVHLSLTPAGDTVLAATRQTMHAVLHRGLNGLPETQLQTFTQILRLMGETFNQSGTQSAAPPAEPTPPTSAPQKEYP